MTKATVDRAELKRALGVLTKCVWQKANTLPALQQIRLSANGSVELTATDLEVAAVIRLERQDRGGEFQALLPAKLLAEHVRKSSRDRVIFERQEGMKVGLDGVATLVGCDIADFPQDLGADGDLVAKFQAFQLAAALHETKYASSSEVVRYALTGVLLNIWKGGKADVVASDGRRLATARIKAWEAQDLRVILPYKTAEVLERLAAEADPLDMVEVRAEHVKATDADGKTSKSDVLLRVNFRVGGAGLYSRIVEGHFPDYEAVRPHDPKHVFKADRKALIEGLEQVKQACTDKTLATKFTLSPGKLVLFSKTADVGEARAELKVESDCSSEAVFNPDYVLEFLKALPKTCDRVTFRLQDGKGSAALLEGCKGRDYIVMPLTITI